MTPQRPRPVSIAGSVAFEATSRDMSADWEGWEKRPRFERHPIGPKHPTAAITRRVAGGHVPLVRMATVFSWFPVQRLVGQGVSIIPRHEQGAMQMFGSR